jgi:uncharacterized protein YhbP (UPF0306 family)
VPQPRPLLEDYVTGAKVMQLATVDDTGAPHVCNLWYACALAPDRLWFISRPARNHCVHLRQRDRVAGAILDTELDELNGTPVRGVTFTGRASELPTTGVGAQIDAYLARWPKAVRAMNIQGLAQGNLHHRLYEITVDSWVLFDEVNFEPPRTPVPAL